MCVCVCVCVCGGGGGGGRGEGEDSILFMQFYIAIHMSKTTSY